MVYLPILSALHTTSFNDKTITEYLIGRDAEKIGHGTR
jgi:hypothetical protein